MREAPPPRGCAHPSTHAPVRMREAKHPRRSQPAGRAGGSEDEGRGVLRRRSAAVAGGAVRARQGAGRAHGGRSLGWAVLPLLGWQPANGFRILVLQREAPVCSLGVEEAREGTVTGAVPQLRPGSVVGSSRSSTPGKE